MMRNSKIIFNELDRHRTGVRGRRIFLMVAFLFIPFFLCLVNLVMMVLLYSVLNINSGGMASMSFFKDPQYIKWILDADLESIVLHDPMIKGFSDKNLEFFGDQQNITMSAENLLKSSMSITPKGTFIKAEDFKFVNPDTQKTILDLTDGTHVPIEGEFNGESLVANIVKTPQVISQVKNDLNIESKGIMAVSGSEGLYADSKAILLRAKNNLLISVKDSKYMLSLDSNGVKFEPSKLPRTKADDDAVSGVEKYRLCMCTETGVLFRARVTSEKITCAIATERPC